MKERIVNFRAIFFCVVAMFIGIVLSRRIFSPNIFLIVMIISFSAVAVGFSIKFRFWKKAVAVLVAFCFGIGLYYAGMAFWRGKDVSSDVVSVQGVIAEQISFKEGLAMFKVNNLSLDGRPTRQNLKLRLSGTEIDLPVGTSVSFSTIVENVEGFWLDNFNTADYKRDIFYTAYVSRDEITISSGKMNIATRFQLKVKNLLQKNMTQQNAGVAYAVLFGDKADLEDDVNQDFKTVGIAHLLAISGLHVGFLVLLLSFVLSKLKLKSKWHVVVVAPLLLIYCYLCSFTPSVVRASLMCVFALLARSFGKQNDALTTMSISALVILLLRPLNAFDIGFRLSFACVFSIFLLSKPISKLLEKMKIKGKIAVSLSTILAVQIGIFPLIIKYMGQLSFMSIVANLVCVPLFEMAYILIVICSLLVLIMPFLSFMFWAPDFLLFTLTKLAHLFASVPNSTIYFSSLSTYFPLYFYISLFLLSKFVNLPRKSKFICLSAVMMCYVCFEAVDIAQNAISTNSICVMDIYSTSVFLVKDEQSEVSLIDTDNILEKYPNRIKSFLRKTKISKIKNIYVLNYAGANEKVQSFAKEYACNKIISANGDNPDYYFLSPIENQKAICFATKEGRLLFVSKYIGATEKLNLEYMLEEYDFLCCFYNNQDVLDLNADTYYGGEKFSYASLGNWTISTKNANIENIRRIA